MRELERLVTGHEMLWPDAASRRATSPLTALPLANRRGGSRKVQTADAGEYAPREDQTFAEAAHQILADLTREGEGDYAWLANSHDAAHTDSSTV